MNIFLIGLPHSGSSVVSQSLTQDGSRYLVDTAPWIRDAFRKRREGELIQQYQDEYLAYLTKRLNINPNYVSERVTDIMTRNDDKVSFVIEGLLNPKDFVQLFDYRDDVVVFLNRTDNDIDPGDQENIAISCMRDYCFYMAAHNFLPRTRWLEYNFKMAGEDSDFVKALGSKNSVFIVKSLSRVVSHLHETLKALEEVSSAK